MQVIDKCELPALFRSNLRQSFPFALPHGIILQPPNFEKQFLLFVARLRQFADDFSLAVVFQRLQAKFVTTRGFGHGPLRLTKPALIASLEIVSIDARRQRSEEEEEEEGYMDVCDQRESKRKRRKMGGREETVRE